MSRRSACIAAIAALVGIVALPIGASTLVLRHPVGPSAAALPDPDPTVSGGFTDVLQAESGQIVTSATTVTLTEFSPPLVAWVEGAGGTPELSADGVTWAPELSLVPGIALRIRMVAGGNDSVRPATVRIGTVAYGAASASLPAWTVRVPDRIPDPVTFAFAGALTPGSTATTTPVQLVGAAAGVPLSVAVGGTASPVLEAAAAQTGPWSAATTVTAGAWLRLSVSPPANVYAQAYGGTVTLGEAAPIPWSATTTAQDVIPSVAGSFTDVTTATSGQTGVVSGTNVTLTSFDTPLFAWVEGAAGTPQLSTDGSVWAQSRAIAPGAVLRIRMDAGVAGASRTATVRFGPVANGTVTFSLPPWTVSVPFNCPGGTAIGGGCSYAAAAGGMTSLVVPAGVTSATVKLWGGGGGGSNSGSPGGAGGYAGGTLTVTPGETLTVWQGGGGAGNPNASGAGGGGGASAILRGTTPLAVAGGGGGGGSYGSCSALAGGGGSGQGGGVCSDSNNGAGGTQAGPGAGGSGARRSGNPGSGRNGGAGVAVGTCTSVPGGAGYGVGGSGSNYCTDGGSGGGGGGYFGGGSGGGGPGGASGGGGSGYGVSGITTQAGAGTTPPLSSDPDRGTAGNGGALSTGGAPGRVVIRF